MWKTVGTTTGYTCQVLHKSISECPAPSASKEWISARQPNCSHVPHYSNPYSTSSSSPHNIFVAFNWPFELIVFGCFNRMFPDCSGKWKQLNLPSTRFCSVFSLMRDRRQERIERDANTFQKQLQATKKKIRGWQRAARACRGVNRESLHEVFVVKMLYLIFTVGWR